MTDRLVPAALTTGARAAHLFPTLTREQIARVSRYGRTRDVARGEVLIDAGDRSVPFFVVTRGASIPGVSDTPFAFWAYMTNG